MSLNECLMAIMAAGAVLGGADRILGNRFGLGDKFEQGFMLLGPLALSMPGIICLMPAFSALIQTVLAPLSRTIGVDPGVFGGILAIDMGGYQLAVDLASSPEVGRYAGIIIASTFGCTLVFTIPVGMGLVPGEARDEFAHGILLGLISLPVALLVGGLASGLGLGTTVRAGLPILILAALLFLGMSRFPSQVVLGFGTVAKGIQILSTAGLILGAVQFLTGFTILPGMTPLSEAMEVVCSIGTVMMGSLPIAELLSRLLKKPVRWFGQRTGMNAEGTTALLIGAVSVTPALGMFGQMDSRSRVVNGAALVCSASALAAHFGFTMAVEPDMAPPLLAAKFTGMLAGICIALLFTRKSKE